MRCIGETRAVIPTDHAALTTSGSNGCDRFTECGSYTPFAVDHVVDVCEVAVNLRIGSAKGSTQAPVAIHNILRRQPDTPRRTRSTTSGEAVDHTTVR